MPKTKAEHREERIRATMGRCAHFTGIQNDTCAAGVRYDEVKKDRRVPCLQWDNTAGATCEKSQWPTREDAEREEEQSSAAMKRVLTALAAVLAKHGKARGLADSMPCPNNCGGTLRYSIASYNGHVHGQCSTEGCASWMQ